MQASAGALESGGGDKTRPFVQNAVAVQDEDGGSSASPRPAAAVPAGTPQSDGGLVRIYSPVCVCLLSAADLPCDGLV